MSEPPPPVERHAAADRFGKRALRTAHDLTAAMADDAGAEEPIVVRRNGPHRSIGALEALLDEALADDERPRDRGSAQPLGQPGGDQPDPR